MKAFRQSKAVPLFEFTRLPIESVDWRATGKSLLAYGSYTQRCRQAVTCCCGISRHTGVYALINRLNIRKRQFLCRTADRNLKRNLRRELISQWASPFDEKRKKAKSNDCNHFEVALTNSPSSDMVSTVTALQYPRLCTVGSWPSLTNSTDFTPYQEVCEIAEILSKF